MRVEFISEDRADVSAYRYDYGQVLEIAGLELSDGFEVHFQNGTENPEIRCGTVDKKGVGTVSVPDVTLALEYDCAEAWVYVKTPNSGTTIKTVVINIIPREKPSDAPSVDDYPQIKKYADYVKKNAEKVAEAEAVAEQLKADAAAGLFNGKDGAPGKTGEKGDKGDPGTTDYFELKNVPFQPVPDAPEPPELLKVPQDLETGAYVCSKDAHILFNGESYYFEKGELLFINNDRQAIIYNGLGMLITKKNSSGYIKIDDDTFSGLEQAYQILDIITLWLTPLFNVSPGQAVTVENADMANLALELGGMDLPSALPNPNALTIKIGDKSVVYDGSSAQTIEIADGNGVAY